MSHLDIIKFILFTLLNFLYFCTLSTSLSNNQTSLVANNATTNLTNSALSGNFTSSTNPSITKNHRFRTSGNSTRRKFDAPEPTPAPTVNEDWGGNCTDKDWKKCSHLKTYFSYYVDKNDPEKKVQHHEIDCKIQPTICLKNGWSVTRCQMICMGRCNKALLSKYDDYVVKDGRC